MRARMFTFVPMVYVLLTFAGGSLWAQNTNPRFGVWKLKSDAPPPAINIMTYEAYEESGMRITIESTNSSGRESKWGYVTLFDGVFQAVSGRANAESAVEIVDERTTKITNKSDGRVTQIIINVLSEDGNTINNEYRRIGEDGKVLRVSHAVYERIK